MKKVIKIAIMTGSLLTGANVFAQCALTNLDSWSVKQNNSSLMNVTAAAAMGGSCGMEMTIGQQNGGAARHWVQDDLPNGEMRYRAGFCLNPNGIPLGAAGNVERRVKFHIASCGRASTGCFRFDNLMMKLENTADAGQPVNYGILGMLRNENEPRQGPNRRQIFRVDVPDAGPFKIEYDLDYAGGTFRLWIDPTSEADAPAIQIDNIAAPAATLQGVNFVRLGSMGQHDSILPHDGSIKYYIDEFESRRQTFIGGTCN